MILFAGFGIKPNLLLGFEMQLGALDKNNKLTFVDNAVKQQDYYCLECGSIVRLRRGLHRQSHYYHLHPTHTCRMHGKGLVHLIIQKHIQNLFSEESQMEYRFKDIDRIADVACFQQKLIFEIQCAPISLEEVQARNRDYASLGYQVVWILHDSRYNQSRISPAEQALIHSPHYFSNMNAKGEGIIYDHFSIVHKGMRSHYFPRLQVNISQPFLFHTHKNFKLAQAKLPTALLERLDQWKMGFSGDCIDSCLEWTENSSQTEFNELSKAIKSLFKKDQKAFWDNLKQIWLEYAYTPYLAILRFLLERYSR